MGRVLRIGLDVGSRSVKVVWTTSHGGQPQWRWAVHPRQSSESSEQLLRALRELLRPLSIPRYHIPVRLAISASHLRGVVLQVADAKQLAATLSEQVPRLFPFENARCHYQTHLLNQRSVNGLLACTVQAAACDAQALEQELLPLRQLGWIPSEVLPKALAVWALAASQGQLDDQPALLLELGARHSMLAIADKTQVVFARDLTIGVDFLSEALTSQGTMGQEQVQLSREEAESLACRVGVPDAQAPAQLADSRLPFAAYQAFAQPVLDQWLGEIQRTIAFSVQDHPEAVPQKLLLCGGGSQLRGVDRWLAAQVELPVERVSVRPLLGEELPGFAVACGLLMLPDRVALNLLPQASRQARHLVRGLRAAITALLVVGLGLWLAIASLSLQWRSVRRQIQPVRLALKELEPISTMAQTVEAHASVLNALVGSSPALVEWLATLPTDFPAAVRLTALTLDQQGQIQMSGQAQARQQSAEAHISEFAIWLEQARICREVRLGQTERQGSDESLVEFSVTCQRL